MDVLVRAMQFVGLLLIVPGLWYLAGGLRVVVSGRIDERQQSARSLKRGVPFVFAGVMLLFAAHWIAP